MTMPEIQFAKRIVGAPRASVNIYNLKTEKVTETSLKQFARRIGLPADSRSAEITKDDRTLRFALGPHLLTFYRASGAIRYVDNHRWQIDDGQSEVAYSDREAREIARKVIRSFDLAPIKECKLLKVTHLHVGMVKRGSSAGDERIIDTAVAFQRLVNGIPVDGPGGKVIVYLDHQGVMTGCEVIWRPLGSIYKGISQGGLISRTAVTADLRDYWKDHAAARIEVLGSRFGYFELGRFESQKYLQPAYVMPLRVGMADQRFSYKSVHVTPAAATPAGPLMHRPRVTATEPKRRP